jgi:hypothetical protein
MNPMEMCRMMWGGRTPSDQPELATEELRGLFFEWLGQVVEELKTLKTDPAEVSVTDIEKHLGVSRESAEWLRGRLQGKKD